MRVLLDECLPRRLKRELHGHHVSTVPEMGWAGIKNGALLRLIQSSAIEVFITIDGNFPYQQNLRQITLSLIVLSAPDNTIETLRPLTPQLLVALQSIQPGDLVHITA
jgi:hypothetical protein